MRGVRAAGAALLGLVAVAAADMRSAPARPGPGGGPEVWVPVPVDPAPSERMYWKRRSPRSAVPGAIAIDRDAYVCDVHRRSFADAERFAAHLRIDHGVPEDRIRDVLVEVDGVYHYAGD